VKGRNKAAGGIAPRSKRVVFDELRLKEGIARKGVISGLLPIAGNPTSRQPKATSKKTDRYPEGKYWGAGLE